MTTWSVPRALALLLLAQTLTLIESTESQANPVSQPSEPVAPSFKPIELFIEKNQPCYAYNFSSSSDGKSLIYTVKEDYGFNKILIKKITCATLLKATFCCLCDCCFACWYDSSDGQSDSESTECCKSGCCKSECCKNGCCKSNSSGSNCCQSQVVDDDESVPSGCCLLSWCKSGCCKSQSCKSDCCKNGCGSTSCHCDCCDPRENRVIWRAKDKEFGIKVEVESDYKKFTITLNDNTTKTLELKNTGRCSKKWTLLQSTNNDSDNSNTLKPVDLDIKKKESTDHYSYTDKDKLVTYTASQGFGFSKLKQSPSCSWIKYLLCYCLFKCCFSYGWFQDKTIWKADSQSQYATKVTYNSKSDKLELVLADKSTKLLQKTGSFGNKQWTETTSNQNCSDNNSSNNPGNLAGTQASTPSPESVSEAN